jgi:geranylgeranyl transferase type-2 subunit alpha
LFSEYELISLKHGIKRTKVDVAAVAARREKEKERLNAYLELEKRILDLVGLS